MSPVCFALWFPERKNTSLIIFSLFLPSAQMQCFKLLNTTYYQLSSCQLSSSRALTILSECGVWPVFRAEISVWVGNVVLMPQATKATCLTRICIFDYFWHFLVIHAEILNCCVYTPCLFLLFLLFLFLFLKEHFGVDRIFWRWHKILPGLWEAARRYCAETLPLLTESLLLLFASVLK